MRFILPVILSLSLLLTACGDTRLERAGSGAVVGGAAGFATGGVCCRDPGNGATNGFFIGAVVGAIIGALLDDSLIFNPRPTN